MDMKPPAHSKGRELSNTAIEMVVNLVPTVGGALAVALMTGLNHNLNQRRQQWLTELAEMVEDLQEQIDGLEPETLAQNDVFVDAVVTATQMRLRTSQQEKIEALRNAMLNAALPDAPEADIQQLYLELIDRLTPTHLRLLSLLDEPTRWFHQRPDLKRPEFALTSSRIQLIEAALPELGTKGPEVIERFYVALTDGGLINGPLQGMMTADGAWEPVTTEHGRALLAFIRAPLPGGGSRG